MRDGSTRALKPVDFHLLLALTEGPMHGYALVQRIEAESTGRVRLFPGNLYSVLRRLLDSGMVRETELRPPPQNDDSRRRYYELTGEGRLVLANEARRMEHLVDLVRARRVLEVATDE